MASDINIKKLNRPRPPRIEKTRGSGLTLRILAVNVVAPLVLAVSILYMGQYRDSLIQAKLETLKVQAQLFAAAIAEGAVKPVENGKPLIFNQSNGEEVLIPELSRRMVRRLSETTEDRTRLFNSKGEMIADSHQLIGPGGVVQIAVLDPLENDFTIGEALVDLATKAMDALPMQSNLRPYKAVTSTDINGFHDAGLALEGTVSATAWEDNSGKVILTAAAPIQKIQKITGVVHISQEDTNIEVAMAQVRFNVFTVFLGALSITIFMSIYLSGVIGRPLKKLARAAETVRQNKGRYIDIPDMASRHDEIGDLSIALRDMTQALWDRMDTIENFAADVAHEIKNPLTSLRSAVETAAKVKSDKDRERLMNIIQHDVQRLDRLISDISNASRLDAELSRDEMIRVDLAALLNQLVDAHKKPMDRGRQTNKEHHAVILNLPGRRKIFVRGNEGRLAQVFENLIGNALSFSPEGGVVTINVTPQKETVMIQVVDEGPGIPENKLETVFERFYSERPKHEDYGSHSGLGLSITKQIVDAHGGQVYAENIKEDGDKTIGACFTVILEAG